MTAPSAVSDPIFEYLTGQLKPAHPAMVEDFLREGDEVVDLLHPRLDLAYGEHPRERFDLFTSPDATATILYLHAGYWQGRDKSQFRFLARNFAGAGFNAAFANHPLCPDVTLAELTDSVRRAVPVVLDAAGTADLIVIGHSAGAHLAVELALADWPARGIVQNPVRAIVGLSGVYDLEPLLSTPLNEKLQLDIDSARAASPVHRAKPGMPPAIFTVGGNETAAFQAQSRDMCAAWRAAGNAARTITVDGADHFTLLLHLSDPKDFLFAEIARLAHPNSGHTP